MADHALLVTSDPYSKVIDPADRGTSPLFGDGAAATWVSREGTGGQIGAFSFGTDGGGHRNLIVEPDDSGTSCLSMNGRAIFEPARHGVRGYPAPIVDHTLARARALDAFAAARA